MYILIYYNMILIITQSYPVDWVIGTSKVFASVLWKTHNRWYGFLRSILSCTRSDAFSIFIFFHLDGNWLVSILIMLSNNRLRGWLLALLVHSSGVVCIKCFFSSDCYPFLKSFPSENSSKYKNLYSMNMSVITAFWATKYFN